eukprot:2115693-Alexandrium_andersonii.AAC.1
MANCPRPIALRRIQDSPEVAMGDCFSREGAGEAALAVLVARGRDSKAILARSVLCRLRGDAAGQAATGARRLGRCGNVSVKTDNQPAL